MSEREKVESLNSEQTEVQWKLLARASATGVFGLLTLGLIYVDLGTGLVTIPFLLATPPALYGTYELGRLTGDSIMERRELIKRAHHENIPTRGLIFRGLKYR